MTTWKAAFKDAANPFMQLVNTVTHDDNAASVPYYQAEQIKEGTFQSENGCDSIFKGIMYRLEHGTPCVQYKCLFLIRVLMLEGPASFNAKISSHMGKINNLANAEVRKGTLEDSVKQFAQAIQQAVNGDSKALMRVGSQGTAPSSELPKAAYKSDFQVQQEREMKAFKKRQHDTKNNSEIVLGEKLLEQFDPRLPPAKFVAAALGTAKKKFLPEECEAFANAAKETSSLADVCAALDAALKDATPLATRFKGLTLVEALLAHLTDSSEPHTYFKAHTVGLQRHLTIASQDNPAKSQAAQQLAQSILARLQGPPPMSREAQQPASRPAPPPQKAAFHAPTQTPPPPAAAPQQVWQMPPSNYAVGGKTTNFDDLFGGMTITSRNQSQPPFQPFSAPAWGQPSHSNHLAGNGNDIAAMSAQGTSSVAAVEWGGAPQPQSSQFQYAPPQQQQTQQQQARPSPLPAATAPPTTAANVQVPSNGGIEAQIAAFQGNMQLMLQMMQQQQQQPPPQPQQLPPGNAPISLSSGPGSQPQFNWASVVQPPPIPAADSYAAPPTPPPGHGDPSQSLYGNIRSNPGEQHDSATSSSQSSFAHPAYYPPPSTAATMDTLPRGPPQQHPQQNAPAAAAAPAPPQPQGPVVPSASAANPNMEMMLQLQKQIEETSRALQQQQQMLLMLMQQQSAGWNSKP